MPAPRQYPDELRERAVRLVLEARAEDEKLSLNASVQHTRIGRVERTVVDNPIPIDIHRR